MCFNLSLVATIEALEKRFDAQWDDTDLTPVYHKSGFEFPAWPVIPSTQPQQFQQMRWGLVPHWVKTEQEAREIRSSTLNARLETLTEKPSFKYAMQHEQRCLIPATGFFEWHTAHKQKFPYYIHVPQSPIFSLAGIWETWHSPTQELWHTFSIVTTDANPLMAHIHNTKERMPLILKQNQESVWLQGADKDELQNLLIDEKDMSAFTISKLISQKNILTNTPTVLQPFEYAELTQKQMSLF